MADRRPVFAINWTEVEALEQGCHDNPHHLLGMHETVDGVYINAFMQGVKRVFAICKNTKERYELICDRVKDFYSVKVPRPQTKHPLLHLTCKGVHLIFHIFHNEFHH